MRHVSGQRVVVLGILIGVWSLRAGTAFAGQIDSGANGVCETTAMGDDVQAIPVGNGLPDTPCVNAGSDGKNEAAAAGDDQQVIPVGQGFPNYPTITAGPNGLCDTAAAGDDGQQIPVGQSIPGTLCISPGDDAVLDSVAAGDDVVDFDSIYTGPDGVCNSVAAGNDVQELPVGEGTPDVFCVTNGANGLNESPSAGDDVASLPVGNGVPNVLSVRSGANGICETAQAGDDTQILPVGTGAPFGHCVDCGLNIALNSGPPGGDDVEEAICLSGDNRPSKAPVFVQFLVRSNNACTAPNGSHNHNAPLAFPACTPVSASTLGPSFGANGLGEVVGVVLLDPISKTATDVKLVGVCKDVRNNDDGTGTLDATGYSGQLSITSTIRVTDHFCDGTLNNLCTLIDVPFPVPLPCGTVASPKLGKGVCVSKTRANAIVPGAVAPGHRANVGLSQIEVRANGGADLVFESGILLK